MIAMIAMIGMVETSAERGDQDQNQPRHYLSSTRLDPETFANAVRGHSHIEDRKHWTLDVVFHDDLATLRTEHGPKTWPSSGTAP